MATSTDALQIRGFRGVNLREHVGVVHDAELTECVNFDIGRAGELVKRTGITQLHAGATLGTNTVTILGHFLTSSLSQLIVKAGDNVYYSTDGATFTLIGTYADASFGIQYAGNFYIIRTGNLIVQWTGSAASNITNSPSGTFAIIYKERMFVLNSEAAGNLNSRFYFSSAGNVSSTGWPGTNFIDVRPGDGDFLVSMAIVQDLLVIFKGYSTWALYVQGSTTDWVLRSLNDQVGCISKYGMQLYEGYLFVSGANGIYRTDGATFETISDPISIHLEDRIVNLTTINIDSFSYWQDKLICLIAPSPSTKLYFVFHLKISGWTKWEFASGDLPGSFVEVQTSTPTAGLYAGDLNNTGKIFYYGNEIYADNGIEYESSLITKQYDLDTPNNMKRGKWLAIDGLGLGTLTWAHEVDNVMGDSSTVDALSTRSAIKVPGPGYFRTWRFALSTYAASAITIIGITLQLAGKRTIIKANT